MHFRQAVAACLAMAKIRARDLHGKDKLLKQLAGRKTELSQLPEPKGWAALLPRFLRSQLFVDLSPAFLPSLTGLRKGPSGNSTRARRASPWVCGPRKHKPWAVAQQHEGNPKTKKQPRKERLYPLRKSKVQA